MDECVPALWVLRVIVDRLRVVNFGPYVGEHVLDLSATHYGIVACTDEAEGRSNFLGKSVLVSAIPFALYGWHDRIEWRIEEDFITRGEKEAVVELHLSGGVIVRRSRVRGDATRLTLACSSAEGAERIKGESKGASAQAVLVKLIGLTEEDYHHTCHFRQKHMHHFVTAPPADRSRIVGAWLGLGKLEACAARARADLTKVLDAREKWKLYGEDASRVLDGIRARVLDDANPDLVVALDGAIKAARASGLEAEAAERAASSDLAAWGSYAEDERAAKRLAAVEEKIKILEADMLARAERIDPSFLARAEEESKVAHESLVLARRGSQDLRVVARGEFDGRCPVSPGFACPAREAINARSTLASDAAAVLDYKIAGLTTEYARASTAATKAGYEAHAARATAEEIAHLRAESDHLRPAAERFARRSSERSELTYEGAVKIHEETRAFVHQRVAQLARLEEAHTAAQAASARLEAARAQVADLDASIGRLRAAAGVFGRNGAQRAIAESSLGEVEDRANASLALMGIDVSMKVSWSRDAEGLASACEDCGYPFPTSKKVLACTKCGARRGDKRIEKLDLDLSRNSGAAEDLAGVAFQLAASAWLRDKRGAPWASAIVDEPVGSLDAAHRRAFGRQCGRVLSAHGITQSFLVAHHSEVVDALGGRIVIEWVRGKPTVRVA